jgi:hypothetical protein
MINFIDSNTPIALLTVGQLKELLGAPQKEDEIQSVGKRYVYGIRGIGGLFNCSIPTASRIKASGKIDAAIKQIGRKIVVDADLALELAGRKNKRI